MAACLAAGTAGKAISAAHGGTADWRGERPVEMGDAVAADKVGGRLERGVAAAMMEAAPVAENGAELRAAGSAAAAAAAAEATEAVALAAVETVEAAEGERRAVAQVVAG